MTARWYGRGRPAPRIDERPRRPRPAYPAFEAPPDAPSTTDAPLARIPAWFDRWGDIVPLLLAEFIVWLGFGGLLPVLPLYFNEQGIDLATLGIVIAAWPIARLVVEPIFGWLADRTARVPLDGRWACC